MQGNESPEFIKQIDRPVIKAFRVNSNFDFKKVNEFPECNFLLDSYSESQVGGTGKTFDWSLIPENIVLPKEDMMLIAKNKLSFDVDEQNRLLVKKNGEVLKNPTTLDPIAPKEAIQSFFNENPQYIKSVDGGRGAGDSGSGSGKTTVEQFIEQKAKEGISHTDPKFIQELTELQKQGLIEM